MWHRHIQTEDSVTKRKKTLFAQLVKFEWGVWIGEWSNVKIDFLIGRLIKSVVFVVQSLNHVQLFATPWTTAHQAFLPFTISWSLIKFMSIELVILPNHLILCCPFLLLPTVFPSIRVFSNESALHIRGPKYWSFSLNLSPSNEHPGLISFRMDWLDLLVVQGYYNVYKDIS